MRSDRVCLLAAGAAGGEVVGKTWNVLRKPKAHQHCIKMDHYSHGSRGVGTGTSKDASRNGWRRDGLEFIGVCPVCNGNTRERLHAGLVDNTFYCAPGDWTLYTCNRCGSAYLDPRPSPKTINLAYISYYTHQVAKAPVPPGSLSWAGRLKRTITNGYRNKRFGTRFEPANPIGAFLVRLLPAKRAAIDDSFRRLPRAWDGAALLDVGFGNPAFLINAQAAGWQVSGVDPDPKAVEIARAYGIDALEGGTEALKGQADVFDIVTMNHVVEHVHDPRTVLAETYRLLKPGGELWLETPNIRSAGHQRYGRSWRGLEPPRHLVLFNWKSLEDLLREVGFRLIIRNVKRGIYASLAAKSEAISRGEDPYAAAIRLGHRLHGLTADIRSHFDPNSSEFISLRALKPK